MNDIVSCTDFLDMLNIDDSIVDEDNCCLISQEELMPNHITLLCGHAFNYDCILSEVIHQKTKYNPLDTTRLRLNQLKCPYCRVVQNKLLPKRGEKIYSVNSPEKYCMRPYKCCYAFKSGKRKGCLCDKESYETMCVSHMKMAEKKGHGCSCVLISGKNKGNQCMAGIHQEGLCKRHFTNSSTKKVSVK